MPLVTASECPWPLSLMPPATASECPWPLWLGEHINGVCGVLAWKPPPKASVIMPFLIKQQQPQQQGKQQPKGQLQQSQSQPQQQEQQPGQQQQQQQQQQQGENGPKPGGQGGATEERSAGARLCTVVRPWTGLPLIALFATSIHIPRCHRSCGDTGPPGAHGAGCCCACPPAGRSAVPPAAHSPDSSQLVTIASKGKLHSCSKYTTCPVQPVFYPRSGVAVLVACVHWFLKLAGVHTWPRLPPKSLRSKGPGT
eukprot:1161223-Pelagomonas_calceolata.AAC.10